VSVAPGAECPPAACDEHAAAEIVIAQESDGVAIRQAVLDGLIAYNRAFMSPPESVPLVVAARTVSGTLVGGVAGETLWTHTADGWLQIDLLWVAEPARRQGLGRRLLRAAEHEAARRGCRHVALDTFDFQARPFYERAGYEVFGVQEGYPPGHRRFFLRKTLPLAAAR
jgi:GNAT superfamily N-acetyltransferase